MQKYLNLSNGVHPIAYDTLNVCAGLLQCTSTELRTSYCGASVKHIIISGFFSFQIQHKYNCSAQNVSHESMGEYHLATPGANMQTLPFTPKYICAIYFYPCSTTGSHSRDKSKLNYIILN